MAVRRMQIVVAGAALGGIAACGSGVLAAGAGQRPSARSLCAGGQRPDRVVAGRSASPRQVTLTGASQVQAMAAALCALPPMPPGQHCPATATGSVLLVFAAGAQRFAPVAVHEPGCRIVTGLGTARWWSGSSSLTLMLDEAVGGTGRLTPGTHPSSVPLGP